MSTKLWIVSLCSLLPTLVSAQSAGADTLYNETYRSQYHFSPRRGWVGDPCGFVHHDGRYRMYWWGGLESADFTRYDEFSPFCMEGADDNIAYFTGSVVIDRDNTAGFGRGAYVAVYTAFEKDTKKQAQAISYSTDGGRTFHYYEGNPVLDINSTEFRDPTVFFHPQTNRWVMVVAKALEKKVGIYTSPDLKRWTWASDFGPAGDSEKSWECPDLFRLPVDGNPADTRWVMVVSVNWAQVQYFVGDFDGTTFTLADSHPAEPLYVDKGLDYYAVRTFRDYDGTLPTTTAIGWVATWDYAPHAPSTYGKGFWSVPRNLGLRTTPGGLRLVQEPFPQLSTLRLGRETTFSGTLPVGVQSLPEFTPSANVYELDVTFDASRSNVFGLNLCVGHGRKVVLSYDTDSYNFIIDRTHCTDAVLPKFSRMAHARILPRNGKLRLRIFVDKSSIEVFANDGEDVFTLLTYPSEDQTGIETFALRPGVGINFRAWPMKSVWH